jgi:hypothetical protein
MKYPLFAIFACATFGQLQAQQNTTAPAAIDYSINKVGSNYLFTPSKILSATPVEDQCKTSTCWSYSTFIVHLAESLSNCIPIYDFILK